MVERWLLARLRQQTFLSRAGRNTVRHTLVSDLNQRPFQKLPGARPTLFENLERPTLRPLPAAPYEYAEWKKVRGNIDYHLEVEGHYYSVPYQLVRQQLDVRLTAHCVECFDKGKRVSSHRRAFRKGQHTTLLAPMPPAHQHDAE